MLNIVALMFKNKVHISLFFLAIFLAVRLLGVHEFTHSEDELTEDCKLCDLVVSSNIAPFIATDVPTFETLAEHTYIRTLTCEYSYNYYKNNFCNSLFGRPPPAV